MSDFADNASELEELHRKLAFINRPAQLPPKGCCYNCDAPLAKPMLYCDADCGDDHRARTRNANNLY